MVIERTISPNHSVLTPEKGRPVRVLIVRIGAMGDVLHAMPAVAALRKLHPDWTIGWAIEPGWSELLQVAGDRRRNQGARRDETMPLVDRWHEVPAKEWGKQPLAGATLRAIHALRHELRSAEYDVCVDMQGSLKSAVVGRLAGTRIFAGPAEPRERVARRLYRTRIGTSASHVVEQGCELLGGALAESLHPAEVQLPVDSTAEAWCDRILARPVSTRDRFAFLAASAGWGAKQWPAERYGAVAAALGQAGVRTLVNEVPGGRFAQDVVAASDGRAEAVPCSVGQMIALVRRAAIVIAGDTGPLHLAAALRRPVVGLYGPTDPARNGPYGTHSVVLRHGSSVTDHSRQTETEAGLMQISVEEVVTAALKLLHAGQDKVKV